MKRNLVYAILIVSVVGFLFFFAGSCSDNGSNGGSIYYIKFKADGVEKVFDLGLTDVEENAFGEVLGGSMTLLFGTPETFANLDAGNPNNFVGITLLGTEAGSYDDDTGLDSFNYTVEQAEYQPSSSELTITSFGAEGGDIVGTFSATVQWASGEPASDPEILITEGEFKVKRIPNDSYDPFG